MSLERNRKILEALRRQTEEDLKLPPEELREMLRKIHGPETRTLEGREAEQMYVILLLTDPYKSSNNQRTETHYYKLIDRVYSITYGLSDQPLIEEIL